MLVMAVCMNAAAQTTEDYLTRYNTLVARVGAAGVGVDYLLSKWESADPVDVNHMVARFSYHLAKGQKDSVITSPRANYMGREAMVSLKDSLGRNVYYYSIPLFDQAEFADAIKAIDKAIQHDNTRLDLMMSKADALVANETTTPDLATDAILRIIDDTFVKKAKWTFPGQENVTEDDVLDEMQRYCYGFFNTYTDQANEAFKTVTERVLKYRPKNVSFINNMGAYYARKKDDKKALKYYKNALKLDPNDVVARQNVSLIERRAAAAKSGKK